MEIPTDASTADEVRALDLVAQAYDLARRNDPQASAVMARAFRIEPKVCTEVRVGRPAGAVPMPGTKQWQDWLDRRTGTTQQARDSLLGRETPQQPPKKRKSATSRKTAPSQTPSKPAARRDTHPLRRAAIGPFTHVQLARRWSAVAGDTVSTRALAELLDVPSAELRRYAREIEDLLESEPWRVRVRSGAVNVKRLVERCEDLFEWESPRG